MKYENKFRGLTIFECKCLFEVVAGDDAYSYWLHWLHWLHIHTGCIHICLFQLQRISAAKWMLKFLAFEAIISQMRTSAQSKATVKCLKYNILQNQHNHGAPPLHTTSLQFRFLCTVETVEQWKFRFQLHLRQLFGSLCTKQDNS